MSIYKCVYIFIMIFVYVHVCTGCSSADPVDAATANACRGVRVFITWHTFR